MRRIVLLVLFSVSLCTPLAASADSMFLLKGTLQDGIGVFNGTVTYGQNGFGKVTGTITDGSYKFTVPNSYLGETLDEGNFTLVDVFAVGSNFDLSLYFPKSIGPNGRGGALCSLSNLCQNPFSGAYTVSSAFSEGSPGTFDRQNFQTLTAVNATTPEPGSGLLLVTGVLGFGIVCRKQLRSRHAPVSL